MTFIYNGDIINSSPMMTTFFDKFAISEHLVSTDKNCRLRQATRRPKITYYSTPKITYYSTPKITYYSTPKKVKTMRNNSCHLMTMSCIAIGK